MRSPGEADASTSHRPECLRAFAFALPTTAPAFLARYARAYSTPDSRRRTPDGASACHSRGASWRRTTAASCCWFHRHVARRSTLSCTDVHDGVPGLVG